MYKIYVGNLNFNATEVGLRSLFERYGAVEKTTILTERDTGQSKGFGFVEMSDINAGRKAIIALNGTDFVGRRLIVNEAHQREDRGRGTDRRERRAQRRYSHY